MKKNLSYEVSPLWRSVLTYAENIRILTDIISNYYWCRDREHSELLLSVGFSPLHSLFITLLMLGLCGGAVNKVLRIFGVFNMYPCSPHNTAYCFHGLL